MGILVIAVLVLIAFIFAVLLFNSQSYHKVTGNSFSKTHNDKGLYGEYSIFKTLQGFEGTGAKFLFNLYIPRAGKENETTEIDVIIITAKGIIVIESKNYGGWIFGDENSAKWCQSLYGKYTGKQKNFFYNPIKQNQSHIKSLKAILDRNSINAPLWNCVVFPEHCEIKKMSVYSKDTYVVKGNELRRTIDSLGYSEKYRLSHENVCKIYDVLYPFSQVGEAVKEKHVSDIKTRNNDVWRG